MALCVPIIGVTHYIQRRSEISEAFQAAELLWKHPPRNMISTTSRRFHQPNGLMSQPTETDINSRLWITYVFLIWHGLLIHIELLLEADWDLGPILQSNSIRSFLHTVSIGKSTCSLYRMPSPILWPCRVAAFGLTDVIYTNKRVSYIPFACNVVFLIKVPDAWLRWRVSFHFLILSVTFLTRRRERSGAVVDL